MDTQQALELLTAEPSRTGIFTDFDGTLSDIVDRPELARPAPGAVEVLEQLARRFAVVGVVSGRSLDYLASQLPADGVVLAGAYGRERSDSAAGIRSRTDWEVVASTAASLIRDLQGVVLERKGAGVALHYRAAPELAGDVRLRADTLCGEFGLELRPGRLVVELVEPGPGKADAIRDIASSNELATLMVAGDDTADVEAFDWARSWDGTSVLVAVASEEAPPALEASADLVVASPSELVELLKRLVFFSQRD